MISGILLIKTVPVGGKKIKGLKLETTNKVNYCIYFILKEILNSTKGGKRQTIVFLR